MLFHCSTILVIQFKNKKIRNRIQYLQIFLKNNTNVPINEILFNLFTSISLTKVLKDPKIQMERSHLIVELNVTPHIYIY
jgi:hypothetical protein